MANRRVWTEKKIEQAKYLLKDHTYLEASELLNVTFLALKNAAQRYRFIKYADRCKERRSWKNTDYKRLLSLLDSGVDWPEIASYFSATICAVRGYYYKFKPNKRVPYKRLSGDFKNEIANLKRKGFNYSEIAAQLNTTKNAVCGAIWRHKL